MNQNNLSLLLKTILETKNNEERVLSRKMLNQSLSFTLDCMQVCCDILLGDMEDSLKTILIIQLKDFIEKQIMFNPEQSRDTLSSMLHLFTQAYTKLPFQEQIMRNFSEIICILLREERTKKLLLAQYLASLIFSLSENEVNLNFRVFFLVKEIQSSIRAETEQLLLEQPDSIKYFLKISEMLVQQTTQALLSNEGSQILLLLKQNVLFLKIYRNLFRKNNFQQQILAQANKALWQMQKYLIPSEQSTEYLWIQEVQNRDLFQQMIKTKSNALKIIIRIQDLKQFQNEDVEDLEFLTRAVQNFLTDMKELDPSAKKILFIAMSFFIKQLDSIKFFNFFEMNQFNYLQLIIKPLITIYSLQIESNDPEEYIKDLDDCFLDLGMLESYLTVSIHFYEHLRNLNQDFFLSSFARLLKESMDLIGSLKTSQNNQQIMDLHCNLLLLTSFRSGEDKNKQIFTNLFEFID